MRVFVVVLGLLLTGSTWAKSWELQTEFRVKTDNPEFRYTGTVKEYSEVELDYRGGTIKSFRVVVPVSALTTGNASLDKKMRSQVFRYEAGDQLTIEADDVRGCNLASKSTCRVPADMLIKGQKYSVEITFKPRSTRPLQAFFYFDVSLSDLGVESRVFAGYLMIQNTVTVEGMVSE